MEKSSGDERGEYDFRVDLPKGEEAENELARIVTLGIEVHDSLPRRT